MSSNRAFKFNCPITGQTQYNAAYFGREEMTIPSTMVSYEASSPFRTTVNHNPYNSHFYGVGHYPSIDKVEGDYKVQIQQDKAVEKWERAQIQKSHVVEQNVPQKERIHWLVEEVGPISTNNYIPTTVQYY